MLRLNDVGGSISSATFLIPVFSLWNHFCPGRRSVHSYSFVIPIKCLIEASNLNVYQNMEMPVEAGSVTYIRYTCPVCMDSLFPPVFQCHNGHLMCEACQSQLENCGICRAALPQVDGVPTWVRNLEIERIIRMIQHPCPNEMDGCQEKLNFDQLEAHRAECVYTKFPICRLILGRDCEEFRISDYEEHYERRHGKPFFNAQGSATVLANYKAKMRDPQNMTKRTVKFWFFYKEKPTLFMLTSERDGLSDLVKLRPYVLAGRAVTNGLNCKLSLLSGQHVHVTLESPLFNLETTPEELTASVVLSHKYLLTIFGSNPRGDRYIGIELTKKTENIFNGQAQSAMDVSST